MAKSSAARLASPTLDDLLPSWRLSLEGRHLSARTVQSYEETARQFIAYLTGAEMPTAVQALTRGHVEAWMAHLLEVRSPATARLRYRSLQQYFNWLLDEGEVTRSPMERTKAPRVQDQPVPVFTDAEVTAMLDACAGNGFEARRDTAVIRILDGTGIRLAECAGILLADVDLRAGTVEVLGKGGKYRTVQIGLRIREALDRYLRIRRSHPKVAEPALWIGKRGGLRPSGIGQMLDRRAAQAGVKGAHAHRFRHTFSHNWMANGGSEGALMVSNGWTTREMIDRYAKSTAASRAAAEARRLALDERLG